MFLNRFALIALFIAGFTCSALAQGSKQDFDVPEKVTVSIKNLEGRVSVIASAEQDKKMTVEATSTGNAIAADEIIDFS